MQWNELNDLTQLDEIRGESSKKIILIFKHSARCSTSKMMFDRFSRNWKQEEMQAVKPYLLDLIRYREISSRIAEEYAVQHESPQVLVLNKNKSIFNESHWGIDFSTVSTVVKNQTSRSVQQTHEG